jgi:hypothetical protein
MKIPDCPRPIAGLPRGAVIRDEVVDQVLEGDATTAASADGWPEIAAIFAQ